MRTLTALMGFIFLAVYILYMTEELGFSATAVGLVFSLALSQPAESTGSGSLTIDGATIELTHAIKTTRKSPFNDFFSDPVVILSDKPISEAEAASDAATTTPGASSRV